MSLECPKCGYGYAPLVEHQNGEGRRQRECAACHERFATEETSQAELIKMRREIAKLSHQIWQLTETDAPVIGAKVPMLGTVKDWWGTDNRIVWKD